MGLNEIVREDLQNLEGTNIVPLLDTHSIVFLDGIGAALEKIVDYLLLPSAKIIVDRVSKHLYIETENEHQIKLSVDEKTLATLIEIFSKKRVKIGSIGPYSIYFDVQSEKKIVVDTRIARVMGDPIQLNLHLYPNMLEVINWLENLGPLAASDSFIINKHTGSLTIFLQNGSESVIEKSHPYYETLVALANNQQVEIGTALSDKVSFWLNTGYFHRSTDGKAMTALDFASETIVNRDQRVLTVITKISQFRTARLSDKKSDLPSIILRHGSTEEVVTPDDPDYRIYLQIVSKKPIQVGVMAGNDVIMFSLKSGYMVMRRTRTDHTEFDKVAQNFPALQQVSVGVQLFRDPADKNLINAVHPGGKTESINNSHILFSLYCKLLAGCTGYTFLNSTDESEPFTIALTAGGIKVEAVTAQALERKIRMDTTFFKLDLQPKRIKNRRRNTEEGKRKLAEKRKKSHGPNKHMRKKEYNQVFF